MLYNVKSPPRLRHMVKRQSPRIEISVSRFIIIIFNSADWRPLLDKGLHKECHNDRCVPRIQRTPAPFTRSKGYIIYCRCTFIKYKKMSDIAALPNHYSHNIDRMVIYCGRLIKINHECVWQVCVHARACVYLWMCV